MFLFNQGKHLDNKYKGFPQKRNQILPQMYKKHTNYTKKQTVPIFLNKSCQKKHLI